MGSILARLIACVTLRDPMHRSAHFPTITSTQQRTWQLDQQNIATSVAPHAITVQAKQHRQDQHCCTLQLGTNVPCKEHQKPCNSIRTMTKKGKHTGAPRCSTPMAPTPRHARQLSLSGLASHHSIVDWQNSHSLTQETLLTPSSA
jgi:hypothetical protein